MTGTAIIVIGGSRILANLDSNYQRAYSEWHAQCLAVHARFKKKTSRTVKNGKEYESTNWYEENGNGGLKSVGKEEPDYKKYYPPEPKRRYSFPFRGYDGHALLEEKDYNANQVLFLDCLAFPLEECTNRIHPLYKNPQEAVNSVRSPGTISARSSGETGQKKQIENCPKKDCDYDYDCDCCPVAYGEEEQSKEQFCKTEKDEKGRCIVLTGTSCPVLCCRECKKSCNSRCNSSLDSGDGDNPKGLNRIVSHQSEKELVEKCQKFFSEETEEDPDDFED
jgi:hypothetical protein